MRDIQTLPDPTTPHDDDLRARAVTRLKAKRDFHAHLLVYVLVNGFLVLIWAVTNPDGLFWPIFPMLGWGIGVVMNAWDVYARRELTEQEIAREMRRLRR